MSHHLSQTQNTYPLTVQPQKGQHENLLVVLSRYEPSVACFGPRFRVDFPDPVLQNLLAIIPATTERKVFGPDGEPGVQVVLPFVHTISVHARESTYLISELDSYRQSASSPR